MENRILNEHTAEMDDRLALFACGGADLAEQEAIRRHTAVCWCCGERLAYWQELLGALSPEPAAGHRGRFFEKLGQSLPLMVAVAA